MTAKRILVGLALTLVWNFSFAQEEEGQIDPNSLLNIPRYEQLFKIKVWRSIDWREKQNKGFFATGNWITKLVIDGVRSGQLTEIYENDSLTTRKTKENFFRDLTATQAKKQPDWNPANEYDEGELVVFKGGNYKAKEMEPGKRNVGKNPDTSPDYWKIDHSSDAVEIDARDIYLCRLVENVIFDKRRSRQYYDMLSMEFFVKNANGVDVPLGCFRYKDLEKFFRNNPKKAVWFNRYNTAENKNYSDAFLLRLFHGTIWKVENPDNEVIFDLYANHALGVLATDWEEGKMMEREHNLWEY